MCTKTREMVASVLRLPGGSCLPAARVQGQTWISDGVSSHPSRTPRILECFLLSDNAFPNTSPKMTLLETSPGHRTLWKEVFIFLRSKGNFWIRVSTDKGGCNLGPRWPDSQCTPIPPCAVHPGGSGVGTAHTACGAKAQLSLPWEGPGARDAMARRSVGAQPGERRGAGTPAELSSPASGVSSLHLC